MTRRLVNRKEDIYLSYVSLDSAITALQAAREKHGGEARLCIDREYEYGDEYTRVYVEYRTPETNEEYKKRIEADAARDQWERDNYERLKKKFGDG